MQSVVSEEGMFTFIIVDSSNTDLILNSAWMGMELRSAFDESTIGVCR